MQTFKKAAHLAMPALLAATAVAVSLAAIPQSAAGHAMPAWTRNAVSCHFGSTSLKWKDATTRASYRDPAADSMATWSSSSVLSLTKVSSGGPISPLRTAFLVNRAPMVSPGTATKPVRRAPADTTPSVRPFG